MEEKQIKQMTLNEILVAKHDPNPLASLISEISSDEGVRSASIRRDLLNVVGYWFGNGLFVPATGNTDDEGHALYHRWDGGPEEWMERFRDLAQHPDELESRQWGIWFVLTDEGASVEELEDLP